MITGKDVISKARTCIGYPYVWGGESPSEGGFDCSGLVQYAYKLVGIVIPRTTYDQVNIGTRIINKNDLQEGDLIFNIDKNLSPYHVMVYSGNGCVIEAKRTGTRILEHSNWNWHGVAVRILNEVENEEVEESENKEVNEGITNDEPLESIHYRVICGSYQSKINAQNMQKKLMTLGINSFLAIYSNNSGNYYRVVAGSYTNRENAIAQQVRLKKIGFSTFLLAYNS